jgi:ArsR family metal-binding transcriptional regulator
MKDQDAAVEQVEGPVRLVIRTWEHHAGIEPRLEERHCSLPIEVYRPLPHANCKACGGETRFPFGAKLTPGQVELEACAELKRTQHARQPAQLAEMVGGAPPAAGSRV